MSLFAPQLSQILSDEKFSVNDKLTIQKFHDTAVIRIQKIFDNEIYRKQLIHTIRGLPEDGSFFVTCGLERGISTIQSLYQDVLDDINLPRKELKKGEDALINALYVCILDILKLKLSTADLKYPTIDEFFKVYGEEFKYESENEKFLLWETANWMQVLFKITTARKNTGLTIQVVPKVVEGWKVKYITGSGMKKSTANRMALFRTEGGAHLTRRQKQIRDMELAAKNNNSNMNINADGSISNNSTTNSSTKVDEEMQRQKRLKLSEDNSNFNINNNYKNALVDWNTNLMYQQQQQQQRQPPYQSIVSSSSTATATGSSTSSVPLHSSFDSLLALAAVASELECCSSFSNSSNSTGKETSHPPAPTPTSSSSNLHGNFINPNLMAISMSLPTPSNILCGPRGASLFRSGPMLPRINFDKIDKKFDFPSLNST